jgi:hypothetical protein
MEHDLRSRYWGHDISSIGKRPNGTERVCVFLPTEIKKGDTIAVGGTSSVGIYKVVSDVKRPMDPGDQHFMDVRRVA